MKNTIKKALSLLLAVVIMVTTIPFTTLAQSATNADENGQVTTDTTATGNNSVGTYLADVFEEAQAENQDSASDVAGMSYLSFDGSTATVGLSTQVDAQLVVAIYTEDGEKMLASGIMDVTTEDTEVAVDIAGASLPEYYLIKAFLLDKDNHSALCGEFVDDTHTEAYQDFEELDIYDFDTDKVINLDSNPDNNFLVVADEAIEIFGNETANTLVSADYDSGIYEFDNIADDIKSLEVGDVFYYQSDENYEVVKVKSIDINGTAATVVADSMDIEEAFEVIKIDSSEFEDTATAATYSARASHTEESVEEEFVNGTFTVKLGEDEDGNIKPIIIKDFAVGEEEHPESDEEKDYNDSDFKFVAEATGSAKLTANLLVYIKGDYKKIDFTVTGSLGLEIKVGIEFDKEILLGDFFFTFYKIITIGVEIKFHFKFSVILTISGTIEIVKGFSWSSLTEKFTDISEPIQFKPEVKIEGEIYIGVILSPYVHVISKNVVFVTFPIEVGATVKAAMSTDAIGDENHSCNACIDGDIDVILTAKAKVEIARKINWLEKTYTSPEFKVTWHIWDFYYSITYTEFGWGRCPYSIALVEFGSYPQSEVTDTSLLSALNSLSLSWASYGYYSGTGDWDDGQMTAGDFMKYADVTYKGDRYRAVKFTEYRPYYTGYDNDDGTYQDDNGYYTNTVYWFKFEPLQWRVLDPDEGFMMCESIIDSQPYNNTIYYYNSYYYQDTSCTNYANDYATSSIRDWLNDDFYHTAFTDVEKAKIQNSTQDNSCWNSNYPQYDSDTTNDKIFLLSYDEVINSDYGFSSSYSDYDINRRAQGTDYAKAQGLYVYNSSGSAYHGNSWWWLRSPGYYSYGACEVNYYGYAGDDYYVYSSSGGIRPALKLNPKSEISQSESQSILNHLSSLQSENQKYLASKTDCVENEEYVLAVLKSTASLSDFEADDLLYIDQKTAASDSVSFNFVPKSESDAVVYIIGVSQSSGTVEQEIITPDEACSHFYEAVVTAPTCTEPGYTTYTCECGESYIADFVDESGHAYENGICGECGEADPDYPTEEPEYNYSFYIRTPSRTEIRNKDGIILHAVVDGTVPNGSYVKWESSNSNFDKSADGSNLKIIAKNKGYTTFTAILCDADGNELARDSVEMYSKSGFFDKIGGFFRSLFGSTKIYEN